MCVCVSSAPAAALVAAVVVVAHLVMDPAQNLREEEEGSGAVKRGKLKSILSYSESPTLLPDQVYSTHSQLSYTCIQHMYCTCIISCICDLPTERVLQDGLYYEFTRYCPTAVVRMYGDGREISAIVKFDS